MQERKFLKSRLQSYVDGKRRGSLKLPSKFHNLQVCLSKLTKGQVRQEMYQVKPDTRVDRRLSSSSIDYINRVLPGYVWNCPKFSFEACARRVDTHRLSQTAWPRSRGLLWPSTPSFTEMLAMSRKGKPLSGLMKPSLGLKAHVTVRDFSENADVATRIITNNVVGIRSSVPVPRKFLPWFRIRSGILFLAVRYDIPIGLVRFLAAQWIRNPFNLWLKVNCRFKYYLKLLPKAGIAPVIGGFRSVPGVSPSSELDQEEGSSFDFEDNDRQRSRSEAIRFLLQMISEEEVSPRAKN